MQSILIYTFTTVGLQCLHDKCRFDKTELTMFVLFYIDCVRDIDLYRSTFARFKRMSEIPKFVIQKFCCSCVLSNPFVVRFKT